MHFRLRYSLLALTAIGVLFLINRQYLTVFDKNLSAQMTIDFIERQRKLMELSRKFPTLNINAYIPITSGHRTVTYRCYRYCGGFGDRIKGIISAYMLALLTERRFVIKMNYPLDISYFLVPNIYDWRLPDTIVQRSQLTINRITDESLSGIYLNMSVQNFMNRWRPYDNILFESNVDDILAILENPYFQRKLKALNLRSYKSDRDKLISLVYDILFDATAAIKSKVNDALAIIRRSKLPFVCLHIRIGKNPTIPKDNFIFDRSSVANSMIDFVDNNLTKHHKQVPFIFIASDSDEIVAKVQQHYSGRSLTLTGPIIHVDRFENSSIRILYDGYLKVVADFYMLGECHTSILSYSGYSLQANLRRVNPYKNLYLYCRGLHQLESSDWTLPFEPC